MLRLGIYTGKVYPESTDADSINECCIGLIGDLRNEEVLRRMWLNYRERCEHCMTCQESRMKDRNHNGLEARAWTRSK